MKFAKLLIPFMFASPLVLADQVATLEQEEVPFHRAAFDLLKQSIPMQTVPGKGEVPRYAALIKENLLSAGFSDKDVQIIPYKDTAAMLIRYRGDGSSGKKPILFSAHLDVVPADSDDWERDPFTLIEDDTFYYGRGTSDNKFDVAVITATFMRLKSEGFVPNRDLVIAFTGDEETDMATTMMLTRDYRDEIDAEYAFVIDGGGGLLDDNGNATQFIVNSAEKTYATFTVTARNPGGHSSVPRQDNAIYDLAQALQKLDAYEFPVRYNELTLSYFKQAAQFEGGELGAAMLTFADDTTNKEALAKLRSEPTMIGNTGTTCVPTMLDAGHAENALPQSATATINCRIFPGVSVEETLARLQRVMDNPALEWKTLGEPIASDASPLLPEVFAAIEKNIRVDYPAIPVVPKMAPGASDALHFRAAGIPSYTMTGIFLRPEDEMSHGLNERVTKFSLPRSLTLWHNMIKTLASDTAN
ncbi:M20/M25/M40 family metallo-hydrolase [Pseudidiomarina marina]|uniref:M20/M25/M40 family metallo-hydrolase n=1 Tax=Pseudidiomarina marina TaxID=502366 RepID=UPI00385084E1